MPTFRPTIGVLARAGDRFARDLFALLADRYDVELLDAPDPAVDLLWCDWADEALLAAAQEPAGPPVIARLHSHELFTGIPQQVRWERVDALVFVADHIRRRILPTLAIAPSKVHTIPNGLDLHRFSPGLHPGPLERIAWCGRLVAVKGVDLLVPVMERVRTVLPSATLHVAGAFEDERTAAGLRHAIEVAGLSDAIELCGPIEPDALPGDAGAYAVVAADDRGREQAARETLALAYLRMGALLEPQQLAHCGGVDVCVYLHVPGAPVASDGVYDAERKVITWIRRVLPAPGPTTWMRASWPEPDVAAQTELWGAVRLKGEHLHRFVIAWSQLGAEDRVRGEELIADLRSSGHLIDRPMLVKRLELAIGSDPNLTGIASALANGLFAPDE